MISSLKGRLLLSKNLSNTEKNKNQRTFGLCLIKEIMDSLIKIFIAKFSGWTEADVKMHSKCKKL